MTFEVSLDSLESVITEKLVFDYEGEYEDIQLNLNEDEELDKETEKLILNIEAKYHGYALVKFNNGIIYEGNFSHGLIHGNGTLYWPNKTKYEGNFVKNRITGEGIIYYSDGLSQYQGQLLDGKSEGFGKLIDRNGQEFEGEWKDGKRNGVGLLKYKLTNSTGGNPIVYFGDFVNNKRHGYGIMKYESGNTYEGEWLNDLKHGYGVMNWHTADQIYTGYWKNNLPHGEGELIWGSSTINKLINKENCNIYRGEFEQGQRSGQGSFFYMNGSQYSGEWQNNNKHGIGCFIHANGGIMCGNFNKNQFVLLNNLSDKEKKLKSEQKTNKDSIDSNRDISMNLQYNLFLYDVLLKFPLSCVNFLSSSYSNLFQSRNHFTKKEIERVLLKYNQFFKAFYLKYNEISNKNRTKEFSIKKNNPVDSININELNEYYPLISVENRINRLKIATNNSRCILNCIFSTSLSVLIRCLKELGLINFSFNCNDVFEIFSNYRQEFNRNLVSNYIEYYQENISTYKEQFKEDKVQENNTSVPNSPVSHLSNSPGSPLSLPQSSTFDSELKSILSEELIGLDYLYDSYQNEEASRDQDSFLNSMRQPLREFEFVNLILRVVLEIYIRNGFDSSYLTSHQVIEKFLAEKLVPLVQDPDTFISSFYQEYYSEKFQDYLQIKLLKTYYHYQTEVPPFKFQEKDNDEERLNDKDNAINLKNGSKLVSLWSYLKHEEEKIQLEKDSMLSDIDVKKLNLQSNLGGTCSISVFLNWIKTEICVVQEKKSSEKVKDEVTENNEIENTNEYKEENIEEAQMDLISSLLSIIFPDLNQLDEINLTSLLNKRISFEDFLEYLSRVIVSPLWNELKTVGPELEESNIECIKVKEQLDENSLPIFQQESSLTIDNNPNSLIFKFSNWINNYIII